MTTARTPWRASAAAFVSSINPAGWLDALHDLIVAEVAANPATAQWTVSDYDAVAGTLELKKLQVTDDVRILLFGGAEPDDGALWQTASEDAFLYGLICPTAGTTGPATAYTAGAPYDAEPSTLGAGFLSSISVNTGQTSANRIRYWENGSSMVIMGHNDSSNAHTGCLIIGDLADDPVSGDPVYMLLASGCSRSTSSAYASQLRTNALGGSARLTTTLGNFALESSGRFWNATLAGAQEVSLLGLPNTIAIRSGVPAQCTGPLFGGAGYDADQSDSGGMTPNLKDVGVTQSFLIPVPLCSVTTAEFLGHLRQIMVGPRAAIGQTLTQDGSPYARAISCDPGNAADALWLVD